MTSKDEDPSALFLATATSDRGDRPHPVRDGSEEAMRRLRDPFAVQPAQPKPAGDDRQ
jgi:hypothetical protein